MDSKHQIESFQELFIDDDLFCSTEVSYTCNDCGEENVIYDYFDMPFRCPSCDMLLCRDCATHEKGLCKDCDSEE